MRFPCPSKIRLSALAAIVLSATLFGALCAAAADPPTVIYLSPPHVFSMDDILGDFDGTTYAEDPSIVCMATSCSGEQSFVDSKTQITLYPIDNEFGFEVTDFLGADQKVRDGIYEEGWVGEIVGEEIVLDTGETVFLDGVLVSNQSVSLLKAGNPIGTWCAGLGGNAVKCSTEMYTVLEHVLTCYESVPYFYIDPITGLPTTPAPCEELVKISADQYPAIPNESDVVCDAVPDADGIRQCPDITVGPDYSVTIKDDGKPLYRWGTLVKRPTDVRLYASLPVPNDWLAIMAPTFEIVRAELHVRHRITNNPNDQLRPEDWENEAATGRLPDYTVDANGMWISKQDCFEGDGDFAPAGTVLKNPGYEDPAAPSADLRGALTNCWYTTINRDPFEWSYLNATGDLVGSPTPDETLGTLVSGPRWRLKSNKFGQNIPGLEIPKIECTPPPYTQGTLKYEVGDMTETVINLLDWDGRSPLATSRGWIEPMFEPDGSTRCAKMVDGVCITVNGQPLTENFDFSIYIKGDKKPLAIYDAWLEIEYHPEIQYDGLGGGAS